jgi:hypothetical protein
LVFPVLLAGDNQRLPREVRDIQIADFSDYFITSAAFRNSPKSLKFEDAVRQLAGDLIKRIDEAPPFNPDWRVVNPGELRTRFSGEPWSISELEPFPVPADSEWGYCGRAIEHPDDPVHIGRPNQRATELREPSQKTRVAKSKHFAKQVRPQAI